jgi:uncharacterized membrane-anchored protein
MQNFFDYIYYRVNQVYFKWDGRNGITSIIAVSMLQTMVIADICLLGMKILFDKSLLAPYSRIIAYIAVGVLGIFTLFNYFKYKDKYNKLKTQWSNEPKKQRVLKGILVVLLLLMPWIFLVIIAVKL